MLSASAAFAAQVDADVSFPTALVTVNGVAQTDDVSRVELTRELTGVLPAESGLVDGSYAAYGEIELTGDVVAAAHPLRTGTTGSGDLALAGADVAVSLGFADENLTQLTGVVRKAEFETASGRDGSVLLSVTDPVEDWRAPVTMPATGPLFSAAAPTPPLLNVAAVVTHIAHACGQRITPADRADTVLSVPLVGGPIPDRGSVKPWPGARSTPMFTSGQFGLAWSAPSGGLTLECKTRSPSADTFLAPGTGWLIVAWVYIDNAGSTMNVRILDAIPRFQMWLSVAANGTSAATFQDFGSTVVASSITTGATVGWHQFGAAVWRSGTTLYVEAMRDGIPDVGSAVTGYALPTEIRAQVNVAYNRPVQAIQVDRTVNASSWVSGVPWPSATPITPAAEITTTGANLYVPPPLAGVDAWSALRAVAAAELAVIDFTEAGVLRYRSSADVAALSPTDPSRIVVVDDQALERARWSMSVDSRRTEVAAVCSQPRWRGAPVGSTSGTPSYQLDRVLDCPVGTSTHVLTADQPIAWAEHDTFAIYSAAGQAWDFGGVVFANSGLGRITSGVTVSLSRLAADRFLLTVVNSTGAAATTRWPTEFSGTSPHGVRVGDPALFLYSLLSVDQGRATVVVGNGNQPASRLTLGGDTEWRQDTDFFGVLNAAVLAELDEPKVVVEDLVASGDPRIQPGDLIALTHASGLVRPVNGRVVKVTRSFDARSGMVDAYSLRL